MSVKIEVDVKKLYKQLCPKCKQKLIKLCRITPTEEMIKQLLEK